MNMPPPDPPRLLDQVRAKIRVKHYSIRTEQAYGDWIKRFILFHGKRHPAAMGAGDVEAFLTHLAVARNVSASTQNQAKSALLFLYKEVLGIELAWLDHIGKTKTPQRLPVVLTRDEVSSLLARLHGVHALIGKLLYGTGLRVMEALRLRIKDADFFRHEILVRDGKGFKDRVTMLPRALTPALRRQIEFSRSLHQRDLRAGMGSVWLPDALSRKYRGGAREWMWQYIFPADVHSRDPRSAATHRHHLSDQSFQRAMRQALRNAGLTKPATPHTLRHYLPFLTMSCTSPTAACLQAIRKARVDIVFAHSNSARLRARVHHGSVEPRGLTANLAAKICDVSLDVSGLVVANLQCTGKSFTPSDASRRTTSTISGTRKTMSGDRTCFSATCSANSRGCR